MFVCVTCFPSQHAFVSIHRRLRVVVCGVELVVSCVVCCGVVFVVCCVVMFLSCVCACDLFSFTARVCFHSQEASCGRL